MVKSIIGEETLMIHWYRKITYNKTQIFFAK